MKGKAKALILNLRYPHQASYYDDWADAFEQTPLFSTNRRNIASLRPNQLAKDIDEYDLAVLLHSCTADTTTGLERLAPIFSERKHARLIAFVGNEYNSPYAPLAAKIATLHNCRPDVIATQLLEEAGHYLYNGLGARIASVPHALNPQIFRPGPPTTSRSIDIGVRNFSYSPLIGDQDRNRIIDHFHLAGHSYGLRVDIDAHHRFDRTGWASFLASCRGTVSSEAGSYYLDRDDKLVGLIKSYIDTKRSAFVLEETVPGRQLVRYLPTAIKTALGWLLRHGPIKYAAFEDSNINFDDIFDRFFKNASKCPAYSKAISSRHLDAVGTRTCQILVRGRYNDILSMDEHYIPVAPDLSDIREAVARFKDSGERESITNAAYDHVMSSHTYAHRMETLHELVHTL